MEDVTRGGRRGEAAFLVESYFITMGRWVGCVKKCSKQTEHTIEKRNSEKLTLSKKPTMHSHVYCCVIDFEDLRNLFPRPECFSRVFGW